MGSDTQAIRHTGNPAHKQSIRKFSRTPISTAVMLALASPAVFAQAVTTLQEVVVTAQKREQNMQEVPISIQTLTAQTMTEHDMQDFFDWSKMVPSILSVPNLDEGTSYQGLSMRGVNSGSRGHPSTNSPTVGMYLDEMPVTTQSGNLDLNLYDVSRIEVLAGPQGTLYGGSAQAGTIRVITNKPELDRFSSSVSAEANVVDGDDTGYLLEGYVNVPINEKMAIRLVGWTRETAGWIDNVLRSRTYKGVEDPDICADAGVPCSADDITISNDNRVKKNYNTVETTGGRAALRIDLNDNWTVSSTIMGQKARAEGSRAEDISDFVGREQAVSHLMNEYTEDKWSMLGLTIEGKIGNFDVVYAGGYLDRNVDGSQDYADYEYWYDAYLTSGGRSDLNFLTTGTRPIPNVFEDVLLAADPGTVIGTRNMQGFVQELYDGYERWTHEIRITTDQEKRVRGMLGFYWLDSYSDYTTPYKAPGLADVMQMHGGDPLLIEDTIYLNSMDRNDTDQAVFGNVSFDITNDLEMTVGARFFEPEQTIKGFTGYTRAVQDVGWGGSSGENRCNLVEGDIGWTPNYNGQTDYQGETSVKPCLNVDKRVKESEHIYRADLKYQVSEDVMLYGTFSEGYRPGGINRDPNRSEYLSEFLTNHEFGWKTQFLNNRLQFNGAAFYDEWADFQISFSGENGITQIGNGPSADILGLETELTWLATENLRISAAGAYYDGELTSVFADYKPNGTIDVIRAPKGTPLPDTPKFKGDLVARYRFPLGAYDAYVQGALMYSGERRSALEPEFYAISGDFPSITVLDLAAGIRKDSWSVDLFVKNATNTDSPWYDTAQCDICFFYGQRYVVRERPISFALRFTKDF